MNTARQQPMHPGWACCDLAQDLAGWIRAQRDQAARLARWSRVYRARADRLRRLSIRRPDVAAEALALAGAANARADRAAIIRAHVDRVAVAHAWRLPTGLMPPPPPKPPRRVVPPTFHLDADLRRIHQMPPSAAYRAAHAAWVSDQIAKLPPRADT